MKAVELAAREAYGRLLSAVVSRTRDIAAAEDALADAFAAALEQWPRTGVPREPVGWLLTAARRKVVDAQRRSAVRAALDAALEAFTPVAHDEAPASPFRDERLELLFVCAHPGIAADARTALMLHTVLGLDVETIASAMRVPPRTLGQRLWRAKTRIRDAGFTFEVPGEAALAERLDPVLESIYAGYGSAWEDVTGDGDLRGLAEESLSLARTLAALLPGQPEALGLLALLLFVESRRDARRGPDGAYVPLDAQDPALWNATLLDEAERALREASRAGRIGPFQLEAAIQSAHCAQRRSGRSARAELVTLYDGLVTLTPTLGALVARAVAIADHLGPQAGLAALGALPLASREDYQPYWAAAAELHARAGHTADARRAYTRAMGLTEDPAARAFLSARRTQLAKRPA